MPREPLPMICPSCTSQAQSVREGDDFSRNTLILSCRRCGDVEVRRDGSRCKAIDWPVERPDGVSVQDFNRIIREVESSVRTNCEAMGAR